MFPDKERLPQDFTDKNMKAAKAAIKPAACEIVFAYSSSFEYVITGISKFAIIKKPEVERSTSG